MLASTVQFSNNDQTPTRTGMGPAITETTFPFPQDPTTCPTQPDSDLAFHARRQY
jgi:hypothetical protein